ncbi:MAG: hypothetical protein KBT27_15220, partial [Prevotellaceae bacterium]|nr:hypothetical protein [Candidatus Faecinaster equi]
MKVQDFIIGYNNKKNKLTISGGRDAIKDYIKETLNIVEYLPIVDKVHLVSRVLEGCTTQDGGGIEVDSFQKYFLFTIAILQEYTNLEFSQQEEVYDEYDALCSSGLLDIILSIIEDDYARTNAVLNMMYGDLLNQNNFINMVKSNFQEILNISKQFIDSLPSQFQD